MDWSQERYVRIYTRDTAAWIALPWEARVVFYELKRKVDRAGVLKVGRRGTGALPAFLHLPAAVVEVGIAALIEDEIVVDAGDRVSIPDFIESEETERAPAARQRDLRERRRDHALAAGASLDEARAAARPDRYAPPVGHASGNGGSRAGHAGSHGVTEGSNALASVPPIDARRVFASVDGDRDIKPANGEEAEIVAVGNGGSRVGHSLPCRSFLNPADPDPSETHNVPETAPPASSPGRKSSRAPDPDAFLLADRLRDAVIATKPNHRIGEADAWARSRPAWARCMAKILSRRPRAAVEAAIAFVQANAGEPYAHVVESATALDDKLDKIELAMGRAAKGKNGARGAGYFHHDGTETYQGGEVDL